MPYKIEKQDKKFCVVKADSGETMKCYDNEGDAKAYLGALYANVDDAKTQHSTKSQALDQSGFPILDAAMYTYFNDIANGRTTFVLRNMAQPGGFEEADALNNLLDGGLIDEIKNDGFERVFQLTDFGRRYYQSGAWIGKAKQMTYSLPARLSIVKTADGRYRWTSISSNNALDRDGEIVSSQALQLDVYRSKNFGDTSELRLFHLPYPIGGAPDFRAVMDGHLVETGEFYPTDQAKAIANYILRYPDAPDGSGWGTSIGFRGYTDDYGVYHQIEITERSVLPLSSAANPYTSFSSLKEANMPISKRQSEFLDQMLADPEMRSAAQAILEAASTSKALDAAGVQRKEAITSVQGTQYAGGPDGVFSTPTGSEPAPKVNGKSESDPTCAECDHAKSAHNSSGCTVGGCSCEGFSESSAAESDKPKKAVNDEPALAPVPAPVQQPIAKLPRKKAVKVEAPQASVSQLTLEGLAEVIDSYVKKSVATASAESPELQKLVEVVLEQSKAIESLRQSFDAQQRAQETIKARYETPRILQDLLASRHPATEVGKDDPLVKQANAALEDDSTVFSKLGFGKEN